MSRAKQIFVVGSSRSGTTMMDRILGNHEDVFTFKELHFFGTIWVRSGDQDLDKNAQLELLSRLLCIQENGLFNQQNISDFKLKSKQLLSKGQYKSPIEIYQLFLEEMTNENNANISCEQTPKNLYYIEDILKEFPEAKVVNLVRDQRDVLLSQKNKWKRKFLGAKGIPFSEAVRSYVNYHPILTAKVWNSSLSYTSKYMRHERVKVVKFEDLLSDPENIIKEVCKFIEINYEESMLEVPVIGSSTEGDDISKLFIDGSKLHKWERGGLLNAEVYLSQKTASNMMRDFGYKEKKFIVPPFFVIFYLISLPIKVGLSFLLNLHRMGDIIEVITKRFFIK